MRYGLAYIGSKSKIAEPIIEFLPRANTLVDLFFGGGAITHCALLKGKYKHIIANDLDSSVIQLFKDSVNGKYKDEKRWISKEDFLALKDNDAYIRICWSFSNSGRVYLYGAHIEPWKKALHYSRVFNDNSLFEAMGIHTDGSREDIQKHEAEYKSKYIEWYKATYSQDISNERLQRLQRLQSLQSLQSLQNITYYSLDYQDVPLPEPNECVIYCDIPYDTRMTNNGLYNGVVYDHDRFYKWATDISAKGYKIYISSYTMPSDKFKEVFTISKCKSCTGQGNTESDNQEKIFVPINQDIKSDNIYLPIKLF